MVKNPAILPRSGAYAKRQKREKRHKIKAMAWNENHYHRCGVE
jgi:hypothetical protein